MDEQEPGKPFSIDLEASTQATKVQIPIRKGHVRRAVRAADAVYAAGRTGPGQGAEESFVLMTAVLLVERLATAAGCEPLAVLNKLADCFELKRVHAKTVKRGMRS